MTAAGAHSPQPGRPVDDAPATMSIGEVLTHVQREFPDVTVSKIRFLESEGLLKPQRAASRYRKFAMSDVERLLLILRLQRDSFLPLKEIRKHLAAVDAGDTPIAVAPTSAPASAPAQHSPVIAPAAAPPVAPPPSRPVADLLARAASASLTASDLAQKAGLDRAAVEALASFGVICSHQHGNETVYDGEDLVVAQAAATLMARGIDARNLRVLRRIADQEATLYEQVVAAALRNPRQEARASAVETLVELAEAGRTVRASFLRQALRGPLGDE